MARIHHRRRLRVLARANFTCQLCKSARATEVHHKKPQRLGGSDKGFNLISTCHDCHVGYRRMKIKY